MKNYRLVNPRMGTHNTFEYSNGNIYPACAVPRGLNFFTIQTDGKTGWYYSPYSTVFEGIRLTHQPSPWLGDYGKLLFFGSREGYIEGRYWGSYDNEGVVFEPAYISAYVRRDRYRVEVTPTDTAAIIRFSFDHEDNERNSVIIAAEDYDYETVDGALIIRTRQCQQYKYRDGKGVVEYARIVPSVPFELKGEGGYIVLSFAADTVELKVATSFISDEQALLNFEREIADKTFDEVKSDAEKTWCRALSVIEVSDPDEEKLRTFYSCLYRALLWPRKFYEIDKDGNPVHLNTATFAPERGVLYTDNGFWDTYRTLYPLLAIIGRRDYADMAEGFLGYYKDTGWLPKWICPINVSCMPGMLVEAVLGDAIDKEIVTGELAESIFRAMLKDGEVSSTVPGEGRVALTEYRKYGYIPYTAAKESVNETLDNAFGDYCIARAAKKLGYDDIAEKYFAYSKCYANLFDKETGFIRGKDEHGNFRKGKFNQFAWGDDYTEGSVWQNGFGVYHDIKGLDALYEGNLSSKIDELMSAPPIFDVGYYKREIHEMSEMTALNYGQCAISNQPSFHVPFIYSELGAPEKTFYHTERLLAKFNSGFCGYPGDEDNGSMASFYILSALGLYQIAPSSGVYQCTVPYVARAEIRLESGKTLVIDKNDYDVCSMRGTVGYDELMNGGRLGKTVSDSANR